MRSLLFILIGLASSGSVAAQSQVPPDQCLGGKLIAIQQNQDSITLQFNEKINVLRLTPDAEIWRQGVHLQNIGQLVLGELIYMRCTRANDSSPIMATLVVAPREGDGVRMVPGHIAEIRACGGRLVAIAKNSLSIKNDSGLCVVHVSANTRIWRGTYFSGTSTLKIGDDVTVRSTVEYPKEELIAEDVTANIDRWHGKILSIGLHQLTIAEADKHGDRFATGTIFIDDHTDFGSWSASDLKVGGSFEAIGLVLGKNRLRATKVLSVDPPRSSSK